MSMGAVYRPRTEFEACCIFDRWNTKSVELNKGTHEISTRWEQLDIPRQKSGRRGPDLSSADLVERSSNVILEKDFIVV